MDVLCITLGRCVSLKRKKKRKRSDSVLLQKPLHPKKWKTQRDNVKRHKNFDYTTIADRLRTVSLSNDSNPTGVVKPVYGIRTFPKTTKAVLSKGHTFKNMLLFVEGHIIVESCKRYQSILRTEIITDVLCFIKDKVMLLT